MGKIKRYLKVFGIVCFMLALIGCGASSSSSSSSEDSDDVSVSGSTTVSGTVTVSNSDVSLAQAGNVSSKVTLLSGIGLQEKIQLTKQKMSLMEGSIRSVSDEVGMNGGRVYLSIIQSDGTVVTTDTYADIDSEGNYSFSNLRDNQLYLIKGLQFYTDGDGNINKVETERVLKIDEGETTVSAPVQPGMEVLFKALVNQLQNTSLSEDSIKGVISTMASNFDTLIDDQDVTIESGVTTVKTASEALEEGLTEDNIFTNTDVNEVSIEYSVNDQESVARLIARTEVITTFEESNREAIVSITPTELTDEQRMQLIRSMFGVADGGAESGAKGNSSDTNIPDFYITNFANSYKNGVMISMTTFANAWKLGFPSEPLTAEEVGAQFTASINAVLTEVYDIYDAETTTRSATALLADAFFDGDRAAALNVVTAFPSDDRLTLPLDATTFSMDALQSIFAFGISGLFERTESEPFDPITFTVALGIVVLEDNSVYITESRVMPTKMWAPDDFSTRIGWSEVDAIDISVEVLGSSLEGDGIVKVVFKYEDTSEELQTVELTEEVWEEISVRQSTPLPKHAQLSLRSVAGAAKYNSKITQQDISSADVTTKRYSLNPWSFYFDYGADGSNFISDFETGTGTIEVWGDTTGETVLASKSVPLYKFDLSPPNWTFPLGPDMETVRLLGFDNAFVPQSIAVPEGRDTVSPRLEWSQPDVELEEGFRLAYSISLGIQVFPKDYAVALGDTTDLIPSDTVTAYGINASNEIEEYWDFGDEYGRWKHLWDTWTNNSLVYDRFVILPQSVQLTETQSNADAAKNYQATYEVIIRPVVVNSQGVIVAEGDESRTNFRVGTPPVNDYSLSGSITFPSELAENMPHLDKHTVSGNWKVGLFKDVEWVESVGFEYALHNPENTDVRAPVSVDGTALVYDLGDMQTVIDSPVRTFTLPTFSSDDDVLARFEEAQLLVWFDVTSKPSGDARWSSITPEDDKIDVYTVTTAFSTQTHMLEENEYVPNSRIRLEDGGLVTYGYDESTDSHRRIFLEDAENQVFEVEVFQWFDDHLGD